MTLLVSDQVQGLLAQERALLADVGTLLAQVGAPPEARAQAGAALTALDETFLLVVAGEFNAGKSSFVNALLGSPVLPEGVTPTTDRIYVLVHGEQAGELQPTADPFVSRLTHPLPGLEGVAVVDTPGTNAIIRQHQALTEGFLPRADLLLFLTSADRPFTESERQFLELAARWGRAAVMVVNKADLLETPEQREEVREHVAKGARDVLGMNPSVFLVSARAEQRGGDAGFAALRSALIERLSETERTRLKLQGPLNTAAELLGAEAKRASAARTALEADGAALRDLEAQQGRHREAMEAELEGQLAKVGRLLSEFEMRADKFIDEKLRFGNVRGLVNSRELEEQFRAEAVAELPQAIDRQFEAMIDRFVESNLHFWEDVQARLIRQHPAQELTHTRFSYDRTALLSGIGSSAKDQLDTVTQQGLARGLAQDAENAMKGAVGRLAGGMGLGLGLGALVGASALDITGGVLAGLTLGSLGLFVLPNKRITAQRQLRRRIDELQETLERIIRREYEREQERADARLQETISPYTQFVRGEEERLDETERRLSALEGRLQDVREQVQQLPRN